MKSKSCFDFILCTIGIIEALCWRLLVVTTSGGDIARDGRLCYRYEHGFVEALLVYVYYREKTTRFLFPALISRLRV